MVLGRKKGAVLGRREKRTVLGRRNSIGEEEQYWGGGIVLGRRNNTGEERGTENPPVLLGHLKMPSSFQLAVSRVQLQRSVTMTTHVLG